MSRKLTIRERGAAACFCATPNAGWVLDPDKKEWVCSFCRKPSPMTVFRNCMWCEDEFVLERSDPHWGPLISVLQNGRCVKNEFACTECEPREQ